MLLRRSILSGIGVSTIYNILNIRSNVSAAVQPSFAELFSEAIANPDLLEATRQEREGLAAEFDLYVTRAIAPRYRPSDRKISDDGIKLIVAFEVTGRSRYEQLYQRPIWPRGSSGVTIGIGYDVGYVTTAWLREDWRHILSEDQLTLLEQACGIKGKPAADVALRLDVIRIGWEDAYKQFTMNSLPRFTAETLAALPNADKLSDDCLAALVSLDYNRGPSFKNTGDRYREMRAIRLHMVNEEYDRIPGELRSMSRLWRGSDVSGLVTRRELEAALFEKGLTSVSR